MNKIVSLVLAVLLLSACGSTWRGQRGIESGIGPDLDPSAVRSAIDKQEDILQEFYRSTKVTAIDPASGRYIDPLDGSTLWDKVLNSGYVLAENECLHYLHAINKMDDETRANNRDIATISSASGALLGLYGAADEVFGTLAIALGLLVNLNETNNVATLYQMSPSSIKNLIFSAQRSYREAMARPERAVAMRSKENMFRALRDYRVLCMPIGIKKLVVDSLSQQTFLEGANSAQSPQQTPDLVPSGAWRQVPMSPEDRARIVERVGNIDPASPPDRPIPDRSANSVNRTNLPGAINGRERSSSLRDLQTFQAALCVAKSTSWDETTRFALDEYRRGLGVATGGGLNSTEQSDLKQIGDCRANDYETAFERGQFDNNANGTANYQSLMQILTKDPNVRVAPGKITPEHRKLINDWRAKNGRQGRGVDSDMWNALTTKPSPVP